MCPVGVMSQLDFLVCYRTYGIVSLDIGNSRKFIRSDISAFEQIH